MDFAEFGRRSRALAAGLARAGVGPGERVLLLLPMGSPLYLSILAVIRLGAVCVFVDPYMGRQRFDACCAAVGPKAFIGVPKGHLFRLLCPSLRRVPIHLATRGLPPFLALDMGALIEKHAGADAPPAAVRDSDSALITFTTGSSGAPKGSNRTHAFLRGQLEVLDTPLKRSCASDFPGFPILPLENLARGRTTFIPAIVPGKVRDSGARALRQLEAWRPEMLSGSPAYLEALADAAREAGRTFPGVRALFTGGAPITAAALEKLAQVWPEAEIEIVYGSTEAEPVSTLGLRELLGECRPRIRKGFGFCVGYPVAAIEVRILPLGFRASEAGFGCAEAGLGSAEAWDLPGLAAGEVGEIAVRGPHVNTGYWNNPEGERANKIRTPRGVWHRMGDAGYFDAAGRLWVVGRAHTAMPNPAFPAGDPPAAGEPSPPSTWPALFPYQAECIVDEFPEVRKSAYLEADGRHWLVAETRGAPRPDLAAAIRAALAGFPLQGVLFHPRLPVDPRHNSKVEYGTLGAWVRRKAKA
jgi:acyl-CoA synthetase (AMP-forming)/AMP-acid ligase II